MIDLDFLKEVDVLKGLTREQLEAVRSCSEEKEFKRGEKLFSEGDSAKNLWVHGEGKVDIRFELPGREAGDETNISSVSPKTAFGWSSLVRPHKYTLSAYCVGEKCRVLLIDGNSLIKLFENDSALGYKVMTNVTMIVGKRFHQLQKKGFEAPFAKVEVMVHMGTCGIAAGAREVMSALTSEIASAQREDIQVKSGGCIGFCHTEPNVTIKIGGTEPVVYQHIDPQNIRTVFRKHIMEGQVQSDLKLTK